jgi:hypothetical protein
MVNLLFKFIINPLMGITVLRKQIDAMIGVIMAESKQSLKESSTDRPAERQRFKKAQACLLAVENIVEWVARLRVYILYEEWFRAKMSGAGGADSPSCWKKFAKMTGSFAQLMRGLLFGALVITISFLATIGQWGGVMAFYDNWVAGSLALLAVFFLYCDSVYKALKGIFSRHSYDKKDIELILKQIFSFLVGFFSGLPSTAVVMAASQDEQHNLFNGEEISAAQIFFTYLNGALLNGMFCFAAVTTLMWFLNMFQGSFSREPTQGYGDAGAYPRAVDLVFGEFMKRVCAIVSDFNLRPEERERIETILRTTNPHKIEDAFGWEREVPSWEDRSPSRTEETPMQAGGERTPLLGERLVQLGMTARSFPHAVLVLGNPRRERQEEVVDEEIVHEDIDMGAEWAV